MPTDQPVPSDIVAALLYYTGESFLVADPHRLHRAVSLARTVCPLLERFGFPAVAGHPMSRSLDEALARLKISRVVRMENTDYERYLIDERARQYIEGSVLPRFSSAEKQSLLKAAAIVKEECGPGYTSTGHEGEHSVLQPSARH